MSLGSRGFHFSMTIDQWLKCAFCLQCLYWGLSQCVSDSGTSIPSCLKWRLQSLPTYLQIVTWGCSEMEGLFIILVMLYTGMSHPFGLHSVCFSREYKTITNSHLPKVERCRRVWWCVRTGCLVTRGMAILMALGTHDQSCQWCLTCPWGLAVDWGMSESCISATGFHPLHL